jgi:hypothetical protein
MILVFAKASMINASPSSISVEIYLLHISSQEVTGCGRVVRDITSWRNTISN